ncbi:hypothetical protein NO1_0670 [Candidatus Termititenax aidoneus]|uniref:Uncharacterized protein n=1 Tax=Termititenax aidoneus TaxID=2218524 RepID=A0A388TAT5_TERA1|nr:hypothetical protein NO1_0670 [Candidatus Termititenax aidoneus]
MAEYTGIGRGQSLKASHMEAALDSKVSKEDDETIFGLKTFTTSPIVTTGNPTATANTAIATEAYLYNAFKDKINKYNVLYKTGNQDNISGKKTFEKEVLLGTPGKNTAVGNNEANKNAVATEAQVFKEVSEKTTPIMVEIEESMEELNRALNFKADADDVVYRIGNLEYPNGIPQGINGVKTFAITPKISESKTMPSDNTGDKIAATEAQAYKAALWQPT